MPFPKGKSGNPHGRPLGSKNRNYLDPSYWFGLASDVAAMQDADKRLETIKWATELIMGKVQMVPATPAESVSNALESQALLKALEIDATNADPSPTSL